MYNSMGLTCQSGLGRAPDFCFGTVSAPSGDFSKLALESSRKDHFFVRGLAVFEIPFAVSG